LIEKPMTRLAETSPAAVWQPVSMFLNRLPADRLLTVAELALVAVLAYEVARLVWTVAVPAGPVGAWSAPARAPAVADPALLGSFDPFFRQSGDDEAATVSSLALTLLGTRVDTVSGRGSAIIATPDGKEASFLVGETIIPGVRLRSVEFDGVTIDRGGASERLMLDQSAGTPPVTPESAGVATDAPATRAAGLAAGVTATPRLAGATLTGLVLTPKGDGAAFAAAGLQPGDVLVSVNGRPVAELRDPAAIVALLDAGGASLAIERGGRPLTLTTDAPR
jgi:general secretion pathway protein C